LFRNEDEGGGRAGFCAGVQRAVGFRRGDEILAQMQKDGAAGAGGKHREAGLAGRLRGTGLRGAGLGGAGRQGRGQQARGDADAGPGGGAMQGEPGGVGGNARAKGLMPERHSHLVQGQDRAVPGEAEEDFGSHC